MSRESLVYAISGTCFGLLVGWILGSQQAVTPLAPAAAVTEAAPQASGAPPPVAFDTQRAAELERAANAEPANATVRVDLANLYFDAKRFDNAIAWYRASLAIDPKNVNASTDLGVALHYANQPDEALRQFDRSLAIDPRHAKTLLNQGIVRAWGKQDLAGAAESWQRVVDLAPGTEEAKRAMQGLEALKAAHADAGGAKPAAPPRGARGSGSGT